MLCGSSGFLFLPAGHSGCFWVWPPCATKVNATVVKRDTPRDVWNVFVLLTLHICMYNIHTLQPKGSYPGAGNGTLVAPQNLGVWLQRALFVCCLLIAERNRKRVNVIAESSLLVTRSLLNWVTRPCFVKGDIAIGRGQTSVQPIPPKLSYQHHNFSS